MARKTKTSPPEQIAPQNANESNEAPTLVVASPCVHCSHGNHGSCTGPGCPCPSDAHDAPAPLPAPVEIVTPAPTTPAAAQTSLRDLLRESGVDVDATSLPYFSAKGKPQTIRILSVEPKPPTSARGIDTLARFKIEDDNGRLALWDVTSKRLLAQIATLGVGHWFDVSKTGSGTSTVYDVVPQAI